MQIRLGYDIEVACERPTALVTLLDPHPDNDPLLLQNPGLRLTPAIADEAYHDSFGNLCRRVIAPEGRLRMYRDFVVQDCGTPDHWPHDAHEADTTTMPTEVLQFLLPSRYCETDLMMDIAWQLFGTTAEGWPRVRAIFDCVNERLKFGYEFARSTRTATEAWNGREGVCRDFAHLAVTLCRCMNIPARYANGFLPDIGVPFNPAPMDYNAWAEVWIGGQWVTLDARNNEPRIGRITVARGRDAADIALLHSFGPHQLLRFDVWCEEFTPGSALPEPL